MGKILNDVDKKILKEKFEKIKERERGDTFLSLAKKTQIKANSNNLVEFIQLPTTILSKLRYTKSVNAIIVFSIIYSYFLSHSHKDVNGDTYCICTTSTIKKISGIRSNSSIAKAIDKLVELNFFKRVWTQGQTARYYITILKDTNF